MRLSFAVGAAIMALCSSASLAEGLAAAWRPGAGTQWWRSDMTADQFKAQDGAYFSQGLRIQSLAIRNGKFAAVWRPGSGEQRVRWDMSGNEFKAQDGGYFGRGLRIRSLELDHGKFAAVWRPGQGEQRVQWGMPSDTFKAQDKAYFDRGLRLSALESDDGFFAAVWRPGAGEQRVQWWMTPAEFNSQDRTFFSRGLRVFQLAIENGRYAAVWGPAAGTQWVSYHRCPIDFQTEDAAHVSQGLRMAFIEIQDDAHGAYEYPWKSGEKHEVTQGNNTTFSHNGVQAYAFDFKMPEGTQIRAARAGTVDWFQDALRVHYDPSAKTGVTVVDSRQYWGNALRIRHDDGSSSWYFHLKPSGVLVRLGQRVEQGQPVALSGDTGRSSEPHLHFQVQADTLDWGQSVAITFANCQVPTGGDTVQSANANANFP
jgi:hypothetical protein